MSKITIRGVPFDPVTVGSGARNHFGEGYWYHKYYKKYIPGFDFSLITHATKTITTNGRPGNMPLDENLQPVELIPRCIYVDPLKLLALNCDSHSNPGVADVLARGLLQELAKPFWISYSPTNGETPNERFEETERFALAILSQRPFFKSKFGIQLSVHCPNIGHDPRKFPIHEILEYGRILRFILGDIPVDLKINALTSTRDVWIIQQSRIFDSITVTNTIPWGELPNMINWKKLFGSTVSPLRKRGFNMDGGLSGAPLKRIAEKWITEARADYITMIINASGGIMFPWDVECMAYAGADGAVIATSALLLPLFVNKNAETAHRVFPSITL